MSHKTLPSSSPFPFLLRFFLSIPPQPRLGVPFFSKRGGGDFLWSRCQSGVGCRIKPNLDRATVDVMKKCLIFQIHCFVSKETGWNLSTLCGQNVQVSCFNQPRTKGALCLSCRRIAEWMEPWSDLIYDLYFLGATAWTGRHLHRHRAPPRRIL